MGIGGISKSFAGVNMVFRGLAALWFVICIWMPYIAEWTSKPNMALFRIEKAHALFLDTAWGIPFWVAFATWMLWPVLVWMRCIWALEGEKQKFQSDLAAMKKKVGMK